VHLDLARPQIRATVACGGHPPALLRHADGSVEEVGSHGTLLGLVRDPQLEDERRDLAADDTLVLYTDGITEARAPERVLESDELQAALRGVHPPTAQRIVEHLAALAVGKEGTPPRDDIAVLALRARG
jgi:serine phosphatase RsbU (regulator of sigma subunit)